ncbi:MAG TPA: tRNA (adenosine(37)-N6)-threonylcarbamoyltransferase complex ATPase subunit type 1 TsaE [Candidatus Paceibacterota bacterium]|nr:tRNA (adenosine(37)-N6)-threonylcarbamoyltransferase complex ATPase subunit type 1 TsaE [Candidatus Paceibacterota bacterium]
MKELTSRSLADTKNLAESLLERLVSAPRKGASVLALYGDLGSGKTALTKEIAALLKVRDVVNSPTFVLEKVYKVEHPTWKRLIHIDAYRLEEPQELEHLGWKEIAADAENLIVVEWAEQVEGLIPAHALRVRAEFVDESTRRFHIHD